MKYLLFLIIALTHFSLTGSAQSTSYGNFRVEEQQLIYQKVFLQDSVTLEKLAAYFSKQPFVSDVRTAHERVEFAINDLVVDYRKFGFSQVSTPPVIQTGRFSGLVSISAREGKYRLTISEIQFTGDLGYKKVTTKERLTNYSCRDNGTYISGDWTKPNTLGLLDKAFTDKMEYRDTGTAKDGSDW